MRKLGLGLVLQVTECVRILTVLEKVASGHEFVVLLQWDAFSSALKILEYLHFTLILMMLEDL